MRAVWLDRDQLYAADAIFAACVEKFSVGVVLFLKDPEGAVSGGPAAFSDVNGLSQYFRNAILIQVYQFDSGVANKPMKCFLRRNVLIVHVGANLCFDDAD